MVVVSAEWERDGRQIDRQFMMPLRVWGTPSEILPKLHAGLTAIVSDISSQVAAAEASAGRGFTYRFPLLQELTEGSKPQGAPEYVMPEFNEQQRENLRRHLAH